MTLVAIDTVLRKLQTTTDIYGRSYQYEYLQR